MRKEESNVKVLLTRLDLIIRIDIDLYTRFFHVIKYKILKSLVSIIIQIKIYHITNIKTLT